MKKTVMAMVTLIATILSMPPTAAISSKELLTFEPVFGIAYLPSKITFEQAPPEIYRCKDLLAPRRQLSVFGKTTNDGATFYYLYGLVEVDFGSGPTGEFEAENDAGIIVVITPNECRDIGAGLALSQDPAERMMAYEVGVTDEVLSALMSDLVAREVKAFGGVQQFLDRVKATGIPESALDPQVRAELDALKRRSLKERH